MGLAASQARFLQLTARKSDIEYQGQQLNQLRTVNAHDMQRLVEEMATIAAANGNTTAQSGDGTTVEPYNPLEDGEYQQVQNELDLAHIEDRDLELQLKNVDTQHQEVQTEVDAVNKVIDKNIDMTFKTFA